MRWRLLTYLGIALVSCTKTSSEVPAQSGETLVLHAPACEFEMNGSRSSYVADQNGVQARWSDGDRIGIFPGSSRQISFTIINEGKEALGDLAYFDGGAWNLKAGETYYSYFPFSSENSLDGRGAKHVVFTDLDTCDIYRHDILSAKAVCGNDMVLYFDYRRLSTILRICLPLPSGEHIDQIDIVCTDGSKPFWSEAVADITQDCPSLVPTDSVAACHLRPGIDSDASGVTALWACVAVDPAFDGSLEVFAGTDKSRHRFSLSDGRKFLPGKAYLLQARSLSTTGLPQSCASDFEAFGQYFHMNAYPADANGSAAYTMMSSAVSQRQWKAVMGSLPSAQKVEYDDFPVTGVSRVQALEFCDRLSGSIGRPVSLPSLAQLRNACPAGPESGAEWVLDINSHPDPAVLRNPVGAGLNDSPVRDIAYGAQVTELPVGSSREDIGFRITVSELIRSNPGGGNEWYAHEYVDLGLPSGTLWAKYGLCVSSPAYSFESSDLSDPAPLSSDLFAYGDITGTVNTSSASYFTLPLDMFQSISGNSSYDPATASWGAAWYTPSSGQWVELFNPKYTSASVINNRCVVRSLVNGATLTLLLSHYWSGTYHSEKGDSEHKASACEISADGSSVSSSIVSKDIFHRYPVHPVTDRKF